MAKLTKSSRQNSGDKMSLYQCQRCGCIENTACGHYHCRTTDLFTDFLPGTEKGMKLCSECGPRKYASGKPTEYGKWHNHFEKAYYPLGSLVTDNNGNIRFKDNGKYPHEQPERRLKESPICDQYSPNRQRINNGQSNN